MKRIGLLVAVEIDAVLARYGSEIESEEVSGFQVHSYNLAEHQLFIIHSGAGQIAAAAATQLLISHYDIDLLVNFGVVGGLTPEMALSRTCLVKSVVHYDFDISDIDPVVPGQYSQFDSPFIPTSPEIFARAQALRPDLTPVICASGDKFIGSPEQRQTLHDQFGADICEMEAAAIVLTCRRAGIPQLLIKTVSDSFEGGPEEFTNQYLKSAEICLEITEALIESALA